MSIISNKDDPKKMLEAIIGKDAKKFVDDLAVFKGSVTKAGQLLSQYGEYYLSPEINSKLKLLQTSTHFLDYELIKSQIAKEALDSLDIEPNPLAAASIGQVHMAIPKDSKDKSKYVIKIQYKGIEKAIKGDMFFLNMFIKALNVIPAGVNAKGVFNEIESVLRKEMDYTREAIVLEKYAKNLNDSFFKVPKVNREFSNHKAICMEYLEGKHLSDIDLHSLTPQSKNRLGEKIMELFLREVFEFGYVQTDAHGGNFLVDENAEHLSLIDFGACLDFDEETLEVYRNFMRTSYYQDREGFLNEMNQFTENSGHPIEYDADLMWEYINHISSPMRSENYNWGTTKLPDELIEIGKRLRKSMKFKSVVHHFIFLDRKLLGVFILLKQLGAEFNVRSLFARFIT
jgi:predicted unusual protein kinase regulating ubiquinone biosynthesis (AarF/ABC1/UbiB family)